jgi:hypothetical protein
VQIAAIHAHIDPEENTAGDSNTIHSSASHYLLSPEQFLLSPANVKSKSPVKGAVSYISAQMFSLWIAALQETL